MLPALFPYVLADFLRNATFWQQVNGVWTSVASNNIDSAIDLQVRAESSPRWSQLTGCSDTTAKKITANVTGPDPSGNNDPLNMLNKEYPVSFIDDDPTGTFSNVMFTIGQADLIPSSSYNIVMQQCAMYLGLLWPDFQTKAQSPPPASAR